MTMHLPIMVNLLIALGLGVLIGIERQWHQRAAGLRTNALVAVGSAAFVALATAAALLVILSNVLLRPLAHQIDRVNAGASELGLRYTLRLVCRQANELHIRALLVQMLSAGPLILRSLDSVDIEDTDRVRVEAEVVAQTPAHAALEEVIARLSLESGVSAVSWAAAIESD
jgi:putative Mg2+ transporter-C (MgtC) family protein